NGSQPQIRDSVGRVWSSAEITRAISSHPGVRSHASPDVLAEAVELLCKQAIIGWFQGGSELGPRALGQRSILCDPRSPDIKRVLDHRIKFREPYRPYAPVIPLENVCEWFDVDPRHRESPFMLRVMPFL